MVSKQSLEPLDDAEVEFSVRFQACVTGKQAETRANFSNKKPCKSGVFFLVFREFGVVWVPLEEKGSNPNQRALNVRQKVL